MAMLTLLAIAANKAVNDDIIPLAVTFASPARHNAAAGTKFDAISSLITTAPAAIGKVHMRITIAAMARIRTERNNVNDIARTIFYKMHVHGSPLHVCSWLNCLTGKRAALARPISPLFEPMAASCAPAVVCCIAQPITSNTFPNVSESSHAAKPIPAPQRICLAQIAGEKRDGLHDFGASLTIAAGGNKLPGFICIAP
jgi:hypothetical protein